MKKGLQLIILCLMTFFVQGNSTSDGILYLNSYHPEYKWAELITSGVRNVFDTTPDITVFTNYLDSKRYSSVNYNKLFLLTLKEKYLHQNFKIVLCSDNNALDFILENRTDTLFANKPIVFCGVANTEKYKHIDNLYGVKEFFDLQRLIEIIHHTSPTAAKVHILINEQSSRQIYKHIIDTLPESAKYGMEFIFHTDNSIENIPQRFSNLDNTHVIYYHFISVNKDKKRIRHEDFITELVNKSSVPIYGDPIAEFSSGIIGGQTNHAVVQGEESAKLALLLLRGKIPEQKILVPNTEWAFNYKVIKKFNLDLSSFPHDAIIYNKPLRIFTSHKKEIIVSGLIFLLLIATIVLLSSLLVERTKFHKKLLQAKNKIEESDKLKSAFLANISHEIRTPLNAIIGFSGVLQEEAALCEQAQSSIKHIVKGGKDLSKIINNIIDYSVIETRQTAVKCQEENLTNALEFIFESITNLDWDNQIVDRLEIIKPADPQFTIETDLYCLLQILYQLVDNALKFSKDEIVTLSHKISDSHIEFCISDSGIGIISIDQENVFLPFNKGVNDTELFYQGAGLGLSIAKSLAKKIKGTIRLVSKQGVGTRVYLQIPLRMKFDIPKKMPQSKRIPSIK